MSSHGAGDSGDLGTERYVRVVVEVSPYGGPGGERWWYRMTLAEGEEYAPGERERVMSVPADLVPETMRRPVPRDAPETYETYDEWRAREEAKRRHPAGRALTGLFTQTHPWLAPAEPAEPFERPTPGAAIGRFEALEARVAELEARIVRLEGGDTIEARTLAEETPRVVELPAR